MTDQRIVAFKRLGQQRFIFSIGVGSFDSTPNANAAKPLSLEDALQLERRLKADGRFEDVRVLPVPS